MDNEPLVEEPVTPIEEQEPVIELGSNVTPTGGNNYEEDLDDEEEEEDEEEE